jgi:YjbE family integral membrane protein
MNDASSRPGGDAPARPGDALPDTAEAVRPALSRFVDFLRPPRLGARGVALAVVLALLVFLSARLHGARFTLDAWIGAGIGQDAATASTLGVLLQIVLIDLLLSGDNAVVIALACQRLPHEQARAAAVLGASGAVFLRVALTLGVGSLLHLPLLQVLSALPLLLIALNLMAKDDEAPRLAFGANAGMIATVGLIIVSDAIMSLDNVLALAAVSGGSFWLLAFGLLLSIPLIVFGSLGLAELMRTSPILIDFGGALLGWVAGEMIAHDPLIAARLAHAPALKLTLPLACAIFVWAQGRWARGKTRENRHDP